MTEVNGMVETNFECRPCELEFVAFYERHGYLPTCPNCGSDYRVFEVEEDDRE